MKITTWVTCLIIVFGWATELLAQFVPVVAKKKVVHFQVLSDGSETEIAQAEGVYYRSSSGDVMDTTKYPKRKWSGKHQSIYMEASTRKTYELDHNGRKARLLQVRTAPFRPMSPADREGGVSPDVDLEEDIVNGLHCYVLPVKYGNEEVGKFWWTSESKFQVKSDDTHEGVRRVEELYDIQFAEPEPSVFNIPANYKIDESTWKEQKLAQVNAAGTPLSEALAGTEAEVFRSVRRGTLPDLVATRLDGVEERLSDYRGRIVLLDFWATWCGPCVAALPRLRELVAKLPADRFALVSISVDEELRTVTRFIEDEPMPWTNWHVGEGSDLERLLRIRHYPTYVLADENGKILGRTGGLIPSFISLIDKAVGHLREFGNTHRLDVESMDLRSSLRDPNTLGGRAGAMRSRFYFFPIVTGTMAVLLLIVGLRGLLTKRPFLFSARLLFLVVILPFLAPAVSLLTRFPRLSQPMDWLPLLMFPVMAVFLWFQTKGYVAIAVTEKSFRDGLLAALEKLQLPYKESLSSIQLSSVGADLQVAVQSWMGGGQIKVRKGSHGPLLKEIVHAMHKYFRTSAVEINMISCVLYLIIGIFLLLMASATLFRWGLP